MKLIALSDEEKRFAAHAAEMIRATEKTGRCRFLGFLDQRKQQILQQTAAGHPLTDILLFGGYDDADRKAAGFFPSGGPPSSPALFPFSAVTIRFRKQDSLSHRDFLGAILALQIDRDTIGDILPGEGVAVVFAMEPMAALICQQLTQVGRVGVRCEPGLPADFAYAQAFEELRGTIPSPRADAVLAFILHLSRQKAAELIASGKVMVNHATLGKGDFAISEGDVLSIRGSGKYLVDAFDGYSQKGRLRIRVKQYK